MSENPFLSIIIATYNAERTLERCLESIADQTSSEWEILISDGGSTDRTPEIIASRGDIIAWHKSAPDGGIYPAWNIALKEARGAYICFLGADDVFADATSIERLIAAARNAESNLVSSLGVVTSRVGRKSRPFGSPWNFDAVGRRMIVCHPGLLHSRQLFELYGSFDESFRIAGDLEFLLRLPKRTTATHVDRVSVLIEDEGVSRRNVLRRLQEQRRALRNTPRFGPLRANLIWLDKLWRLPVAKLFGLSH